MSASDRLSGRVVEPSTNHLVIDLARSDRGADGVRPPNAQPSQRTGRSQLQEIDRQLAEVDRRVIQTVAELHYVTTSQVERLHFQHEGRSKLAASRATRRHLTSLYRKGLIERLERRVGGIRAGSSSYVVALTAAGHRLNGSSSRRRSREPGRLHLDHVLAVSELAVRLHETAAERPTIELARIEVEPNCWRPFVAAHGARGLLKPDARVTLRCEDVERHWFVEIDRGSEHGPVIRRKMRTYVDAWQAGVEQADGPFPQVLWIVPDERRGDAIEHALSRLNGLPDGMAVVATSVDALAVMTEAPT
jgi:hypothetical protein